MTNKNFISYYNPCQEITLLSNEMIEKARLQLSIDTYYNQLIYYSKQQLWGKPYKVVTAEEFKNINELMKSNDLLNMQLLERILLAKLNTC